MKKLILLLGLFLPSVSSAGYYDVQQNSVIPSTIVVTNDWYYRGNLHLGVSSYTVQAKDIPCYTVLRASGVVETKSIITSSITVSGKIVLGDGTIITSTSTLGGSSVVLPSFALGKATSTLDMNSNAILNVSSMSMINCTASGGSSVALGYNSTATGIYSTALGDGAHAINSGAFALGYGITSSGIGSFAIGSIITNAVPNSFMVGFGAKEFEAYGSSCIVNNTLQIDTMTTNGKIILKDGGVAISTNGVTGLTTVSTECFSFTVDSISQSTTALETAGNWLNIGSSITITQINAHMVYASTTAVVPNIYIGGASTDTITSIWSSNLGSLPSISTGTFYSQTVSTFSTGSSYPVAKDKALYLGFNSAGGSHCSVTIKYWKLL